MTLHSVSGLGSEPEQPTAETLARQTRVVARFTSFKSIIQVISRYHGCRSWCHLHLHRKVGRRYAGGKGGGSSRRHTSFFSLYRGGGRESESSSAHKSKLSQSFHHSRFSPNCALSLCFSSQRRKAHPALNQQASKDAERRFWVPNTHTALTRRAVNPSPGSRRRRSGSQANPAALSVTE